MSEQAWPCAYCGNQTNPDEVVWNDGFPYCSDDCMEDDSDEDGNALEE